jgi:hypothetical protein
VSNPWAAWLGKHGTSRFQLGRKEGWDTFVNAAPRPDFETLTRAQMDRLSEDERVDYNEARMVWNANLPIVRTAQMARAEMIIEQVMASARRDGDRLRGSVVIDAAAGLGKTTIATQYARGFHRAMYRRHGPVTGDGHQFLPVAFVSLGSSITLKGVNQRLLQFYGHPAAMKATTDRLGSLLVDCVTSCRTRMIIIDDLHFVDFKDRHGAAVSNHLKWLSNEVPVTFVYAGVGLERRRFFSEGGLGGEDLVYAQTARRATRCPVEPFAIRSDAGLADWLRLLRALGGHLKLADADDTMLVEQARELFRRTQGHIASLTNLLDRACWLAIRDGSERITKDVLAKVRVDNAGEIGARIA